MALRSGTPRSPPGSHRSACRRCASRATTMRRARSPRSAATPTCGSVVSIGSASGWCACSTPSSPTTPVAGSHRRSSRRSTRRWRVNPHARRWSRYITIRCRSAAAGSTASRCSIPQRCSRHSTAIPTCAQWCSVTSISSMRANATACASSARPTCVQFKTHSDDFATDPALAPGWRWFELAANGKFTSGVGRAD